MISKVISPLYLQYRLTVRCISAMSVRLMDDHSIYLIDILFSFLVYCFNVNIHVYPVIQCFLFQAKIFRFWNVLLFYIVISLLYQHWHFSHFFFVKCKTKMFFYVFDNQTYTKDVIIQLSLVVQIFQKHKTGIPCFKHVQS